MDAQSVATVFGGLALLTVSACLDDGGLDDGRVESTIDYEAVVAEIVTVIGDDESRGPEYLFGSISSVATDPNGRVYVADRTTSNVRIYSLAGELLQTIGREGEGPGEFQVPSDLLFVGRDLWVQDLTRIQQMIPRVGSTVPDSLGVTLRLRDYASAASNRARMVGAQYFYPRYFFPFTGGARYFYEIFGLDGSLDTLDVPPLRNMAPLRGTSYRLGRLDRSERELISSLNRAPFEPVASWDLTTDGTLLMSSGDGATVIELASSGDTIREFALPGPIRLVPQGEKSDSARALNARLAQLTVPLRNVENVSPFIVRGELPDSLPTVLAVHVGADDRVWVQVWPSQAGITEFVRFDRAGRYVATIQVPVRLSGSVPPHFRGEYIVGVAEDATTGTQSVVVARVRG